MKSEMLFGCIVGMVLLPIVLTDPQDSMSLDDFSEGNTDEYIQAQRENFKKLAAKNINFTSRFLSMFDEMIQHGIIT